MSAEVLQFRGVDHAFGDVRVLQALDLTLRHGEFVSIVGPSGCGKTTLLLLSSGQLRPTGGDVRRRGPARVVYQENGLFPWLTVEQNIALGLRHVRDAAKRRALTDEMISLIRLHGFERHYPHQVSGGMRQRVELARALAGDGEILLLDEPFSALDYQTRLRMRRELVRLLHERPRSVLFVTHDIEEAAQLADRVILLSDRPATIRGEFHIATPRPRAVTDPAVTRVVDAVIRELGLEREESEPDAEPLSARSAVVREARCSPASL